MTKLSTKLSNYYYEIYKKIDSGLPGKKNYRLFSQKNITATTIIFEKIFLKNKKPSWVLVF